MYSFPTVESALLFYRTWFVFFAVLITLQNEASLGTPDNVTPGYVLQNRVPVAKTLPIPIPELNIYQYSTSFNRV